MSTKEERLRKLRPDHAFFGDGLDRVGVGKLELARASDGNEHGKTMIFLATFLPASNLDVCVF